MNPPSPASARPVPASEFSQPETRNPKLETLVPPSWFDTPAKLAALDALARELEGTPFFANSEAPGRDGGMDCVHLLNYIFRTLGVIGPLEIPVQVMDHGQHSGHSLLLEAFETWPELRRAFARVPDCSTANILPGDVLCFIAGKVPHHGAVMISPTEFLHTVKPAGAHRFQLGAAFRGQRILGHLAAIYRPLPVA